MNACDSPYEATTNDILVELKKHSPGRALLDEQEAAGSAPPLPPPAPSPILKPALPPAEFAQLQPRLTGTALTEPCRLTKATTR